MNSQADVAYVIADLFAHVLAVSNGMTFPWSRDNSSLMHYTLITWVMATASIHLSVPAAEVVPFPAGPIEAWRDRVRAVLRGDRSQKPLRLSTARPLGRARVGLIALEEATKALDDLRQPFAADRIARVVNVAERALENVDLSPAEFDAMVGYLTVILKLIDHPRPANAVRMLYHHRAWGLQHLDWLILQAGSWPHRPHTYRALRGMRHWLSEDQRQELRRRLRAADRRLDALSMLEVFGGLAPRRYVHLIHCLAHDLTSGRPNDTRYRARAVEMEVRAVDRLQKRWRDGDLLVRRAVLTAAGMAGTERTRVFFRMLKAGRIEIDLDPRVLTSSDPLRLDPRSAANVVDFSECARRLSR